MPPEQFAEIPGFLYGTAWKEDRTASLTELALRAGFRGIDTANQRRHYFEEAVGQGISAAKSAGVVTRTKIFLQTKFTYQRGQDHRLPYDPAAKYSTQVAQSLASSLKHLGTDYVDSYVLHGPSSNVSWTDADAEAWEAMVAERDAGRCRFLGVSNISLNQLDRLIRTHASPPSFVQNRCYASLGWDREVRGWCSNRGIIYQGFSLHTANLGVLGHPLVKTIARLADATPAQTLFAFARSVGMLPLTGTSDPKHMKHDLAAPDLILPGEAVQ